MTHGQHERNPAEVFARTALSLVLMVACVLGMAYLMRTFVFQAYKIPTGSMEDTIAIDDMIISEMVTYHDRDPKAGEIVTFNDPVVSGRVLIKLCIATEGQVIDISNGNLYIDGVLQEEEYVDGKPTYQLASSVVSYPYTVPQHCIWVMGDNRTNSQDSRYFGAISIDEVLGRAVLIYYPLNHITIL